VLEQQAGCRLAHLAQRLMHRGRRIGVRRELDVVEADDGDILAARCSNPSPQ
jgi:hypothetical protein